MYLIIVNKFTDNYIEVIDLIDFYEFLFKNYNELLNKSNLNNDEKIIIKFIEYLKKFDYVKKLKNLLVLDIEKIKNNNILLEFIYILLFLLINSLKFNKFINLKIIENNKIMIKYLKLFKNKIKNISNYKLTQNLSLMKIKPFIWNKDGLNGGFLFYKSSLQIFKSLNLNNKFKFNDFYINLINKLSSQKFFVDFNLLELIKKYKFIFFGDLKYLINEKNNLIKELIDFFKQKYLIKNEILLKKIRKNLVVLLKELDLNILLNEYNLLLKYYKKIKYEFKNNLKLVLLFLKLKTYFEKFVKIVVFDRIYNELNLEFKNVIVYLPHRIDYRGRIYNYGEITPQNEKWLRSCFKLADGININLRFFYILQIYLVKSFGKKLIDSELYSYYIENFFIVISNFNENLKKNELKLIEFLKEAKNPFEFLKVFYELVNIYEHIRKNLNVETYKCYLLIELDITSSFSQVFSLFFYSYFNFSELKKIGFELNKVNLYKDFYIIFFEDFLNRYNLNDFNNYIKKKFNLILYDFRSIIKKLIMVTYYNAGYKTLIFYFKELFLELIINKNIDLKLYFDQIIFNYFNEFIKYLLNEKKLKSIKKFFNETVSLFYKTKQNVSYPFIFDSEIMDKQIIVFYNNYKIKEYEFKLNRKLINKKFGVYYKLKLNLLNYNKINFNKNKISFIPNFIHSGDAAVLTFMVYELLIKRNINVLGIHDCFLISPLYYQLVEEIYKTIILPKILRLNYFDDQFITYYKNLFTGQDLLNFIKSYEKLKQDLNFDINSKKNIKEFIQIIKGSNNLIF